MTENERIQFSVRGVPIPKGSKKAFVIKGDNPKAIVVDANPKTKPWQTLIKHVAAQYAPEDGPWEGPIAMTVTIYLPIPKNIPKQRLGYPITRPDALKLCRAVEDSLSEIIYKDDAQVVNLQVLKRYGPVGVKVRVWQITKYAEISNCV